MKYALALLAAFVTATQSPAAPAQVGQVAPDFTLTDCTGKAVSLSNFRGKPVVLEWTNAGCPFVVKHYGPGNMQKLQKDATERGVAWLTICSSAPGKQGHMSAAEAAKACEASGAKATAYLLDEDGKVGQLYGAKRTPEMYVISPEGVLVYHGAIDDKKSTDPADIPGSKNHVVAALEEVLAGKPVTTPQTEAYGCSVKYAN